MLSLHDALKDLGIQDCGTKTLYKNKGRETYLLSGKLPWNCDNAVLKIIGEPSVNEAKFYKEPLLDNYRPEVYFVDKQNRFVVIEYVQCCGKWDNTSFNKAICLMADMHSSHWDSEAFPEWIPKVEPVSDERLDYFCTVINGCKISALSPYVDTLKSSAEKVKTLFNQVLESPCTLIHGDFMYVNMGIGKSGLVLYDWSEIKIAPSAYEICYAVEHYDEVFPGQINKNALIGAYIARLRQNGIVIDENKFMADYKIAHLYRWLYGHIISYIKADMPGPLMRKVRIVCKK